MIAAAVVRVFVRRPRGRWKLLGEFTDRTAGFAAADPWPMVYMNDQTTAKPPLGFGPWTRAPSAPDERGAPAASADPDD